MQIKYFVLKPAAKLQKKNDMRKSARHFFVILVQFVLIISFQKGHRPWYFS